MKKQMIVASMLVLSACAQTPTPVTTSNGNAAMAGMKCSCCQNMQGNSMPQGMMPSSDAKQCAAMCAGMKKSIMTAPAAPIETPDKNPHQQHHP
jgi:hypothetical protein